MLSYQRPDSLLRLLNSLEQSEYNFVEGNPNWQLLLEIRVDGGGGSECFTTMFSKTIVGGGEEGATVEHLANTFNFSHGRKVLRLTVISSLTN